MEAKADAPGPRNLKLGLVTETYPPEVNGVAMTLGRLVDGLSSRDHCIEIFHPAQHEHDMPEATRNVRHTRMPGMPIPGYTEMRFGFPARRYFQRRWQSERPDVLYVATEGPLGASAIHAARRLDIPVLSGFHTNFHTYSSHYRLGWLSPAIFAYLRRLHNRTRATLVPTAALANDLRARGFDRVEVMPRGVDTRLFSPARRSDALRRQWQADDDTIVCLYVGRIAAEKNIHQAIETVNALATHCKVRFVLVGDGPLREKLQQLHPGFVFCGTKLGETLAAHYASADVLLFPSRTETFGNVVTEAMASGIAVVAYDEAAAHEHIKDGQNGVIASDSSTHDFTAAALRLCRQPDAIRAIGTAAAAYCQGLGWPLIVQRFESLLQDACRPTESTSDGVCSAEASS